MAWPFTYLTKYIPNNLPAIKAVDLNGMQEAIMALFGADGVPDVGGSLKRLLVDGIGGQDTSSIAAGMAKIVGGLLVNAASATDAALQMTPASGTPPFSQLMLAMPLSATAIGRVYLTGGPGIYITLNASFNGTVWKSDDATKASYAIRIGLTDVSIRSKAVGASEWASSAWENGALTAGNVTASGTVQGETVIADYFQSWRGTQIGPADWASFTNYVVGDQIISGPAVGIPTYRGVFRCTVSGASGDTLPVNNRGTIADGTVTWVWQYDILSTTNLPTSYVSGGLSVGQGNTLPGNGNIKAAGKITAGRFAGSGSAPTVTAATGFTATTAQDFTNGIANGSTDTAGRILVGGGSAISANVTVATVKLARTGRTKFPFIAITPMTQEAAMYTFYVQNADAASPHDSYDEFQIVAGQGATLSSKSLGFSYVIVDNG